MTRLGSLWQTTSTFNRQSISLDQIWWQQSFYDEKIVFRIGKVDLSDFVDFYMYSSAKRYFLNEAFSQNPTIPFPETGLLGYVKVIPNDIFYVLFSLGDLKTQLVITWILNHFLQSVIILKPLNLTFHRLPKSLVMVVITILHSGIVMRLKIRIYPHQKDLISI